MNPQTSAVTVAIANSVPVNVPFVIIDVKMLLSIYHHSFLKQFFWLISIYISS